MSVCPHERIGLAVLSVALFVSFCLNVIFFIKRRATCRRDTEESFYPHISEGETLSQHEGQYFHDLNHREQQENPQNHHEQQENPIYGNIATDREGAAESCYEMMTMQRTRDCKKSLDPDLNYASLDLKVAKRRKNRLRHQQSQTQGQNTNTSQDKLPAHLMPPAHTFFEVDASIDAHLPPRDTSTMVSYNSIYLNSQQIAQEAEERERSINTERENMGWDDTERREGGESNEWKGERESKEDGCNENASRQFGDVETIQDGTDHFTSSFSHDSD